MKSFAGKLAVVTGGGSGIGRELVFQLATAGCSVAACDWDAESIADTAGAAQERTTQGAIVSGHVCDVSNEADVQRFRDELLTRHTTQHVDLMFNNAGIGGGASFLAASREEWERTFAVDWWGVYYCSRTFLPLLIASEQGVLVNTSSVNGFWATLGPNMPNTAYATAKFAVKGFTEALIEDLRTHAPHVRAAVVIPGHVGTDIIANTRRAHRHNEPDALSDAQVQALVPPEGRVKLVRAGMLAADASVDDLRQLLARRESEFRDNAPLSAAAAASTILDGIRAGAWRILVGRDAAALDSAVRAHPDAAYDYPTIAKAAADRATT
ncbi:MAG: SDR family NAD(P)-dependent oxidoreductase [Solirubrobacterales bacterium]|nr:SDR family NAD(P)-dependent oxidoreductase [Solirubrobacterales bacterium]